MVDGKIEHLTLDIYEEYITNKNEEYNIGAIGLRIVIFIRHTFFIVYIIHEVFIQCHLYSWYMDIYLFIWAFMSFSTPYRPYHDR